MNDGLSDCQTEYMTESRFRSRYTFALKWAQILESRLPTNRVLCSFRSLGNALPLTKETRKKIINGFREIPEKVDFGHIIIPKIPIKI